MKDTLNRKIKFREAFRPFAPSVLEEYAGDYFEGNLSNALFMNQIFRVKKEAQSRIPAVTHIDETARIQVVTRKVNPRYYDLIHAFYEITGIPVLVNTSFNIKTEPIVDSPQQAINCFLKTGIDILCLGNYVAAKD
jgi:carbamoyltransferase